MVGILTSPLGGSTGVTLLTSVLCVTSVICSKTIQNALVIELVRPQGFCCSGSVMSASPEMSEARSV